VNASTFTLSQALSVTITGAGFIMPNLTEPAGASPPPIVPTPNDRRQRYRRMKGVHSV
jgi:hypothetical protein